MFSISIASNGYKWTHTYNMHGEEEGLPTLSPVGPSICRLEAADGRISLYTNALLAE